MKSTPAEIMRKAYDPEISLWRVRSRTEPDGSFQIVRYRDGFAEYDVVSSSHDEHVANHMMAHLAKEAGHRAAIRALVNMIPTDKMGEAAEIAMDDANVGSAWDIVKAGLLAAEAEGKTP
jgi:hypothetical protein